MMNDRNHARRFNSVMPGLNEEWAAEVLGMRVNSHNGVDLISEDGRLGVEVKFTLVGKKSDAEKYPHAWTVLEHQMNFAQERRAYWGLGTYELKNPVRTIELDFKDLEGTRKRLERLVLRRNLWIVSWGWMERYNPSETSGRTAISEWQNTFRYPKLKDLPETVSCFDVKKGRVNLTHGVRAEDFSYLFPDGVGF